MPYWPYDPSPYDSSFQKYGSQYGIDPGMLRTMAQIESGLNPRAQSPAGARGLMQFMGNTGPSYGLVNEEDYWDPDKSIHAGAKYMKELYDRFGDWDQARAAYNMGPTALAKRGGDYSGVPETVAYNEKFKKLWKDPKAETVQDAFARTVGEGSSEGQSSVRSAYDAIFKEGGAPSQDREYKNPYPKGSREYFEYGRKLGMQPAIRPSTEVEGSVIPGTEVPEGPGWGSPEDVYPTQYKARLLDGYMDADTLTVQEMGTGEQFPIRFSDIQAAESDTLPGRMATDYVKSLLEPGDQLTIETKPGWTGKYGRDIGKVYVSKDGRTIDLSTPYARGGDTAAFGGRDESQYGVGATARALFKSAALDVAELGAFGTWGLDIITGPGTPESLEGAQTKFKNWESKLKEAQATYVARGWDPEDKVYDVPGLGQHTAGELGRALGTSAAYTVGLTWGVGKLLKVAKFGTKALNLASKSPDMAHTMRRVEQGLESWPELVEMQKRLAADGVTGTEAIVKLDEFIQKFAKVSDDAEKLVHLIEPATAWQNMTWGQRLGQLKDLYITHATDKYHPIMALARKVGKEDEAAMFLNRLRAGSDVEESPITSGVPRWFKNERGIDVVDPRANESLKEIWQGVDGPELYLNGTYMAAERLLHDIAPRWDKLVKKHGVAEATRIAKKEGLPIVTTSDRVQSNKLLREIKGLYDDMGEDGAQAWKGAQDRMFRMRQWEDAMLQQMKDVGWLREVDIVNMRRHGEKYLRFSRLNHGLIEKMAGKGAVEEMIALEQKMLRGDKDLAIAGRNLSARSTQRRPINKLTGSLGEETKKMIIDPFQGAVVKAPAIQRAVNQQQVRNMMGDYIDELMAKGDDYGRYLDDVVQKTEDPHVVQSILDGSSERGFVTTRVMREKVAGKTVERIKRTAYMVDDPALAETLRAMSPAQMSLFKQMMNSGLGRAITAPTRLFRAGTVLGLSFMVRNPIRDQLMAATLTKYGYNPVTDWFRGLYHVLSKSDLYQAMHGAGGTQSSFVSDDILQTTGKVIDMSTRENLTDMFRKKLREEAAEPITAKRVVSAIRESNAQRVRKATGNRFSTFSPKEVETAGGRVARRIKDVPGTMKDQASGALYGLRRVSEVFEEATRIGAVAKAVRRAEKGKGYTTLRALDEAAGGMSGWYKMLAGRQSPKGFWKRFGEARTAVSPRGKDGRLLIDRDMIDEMRNITLDFQRKGISGEVLNAFYPFFNAELQDYARFGRAMREAPLTTAARAFTFVSVPAIANWYANFDNPEYQAQTDIEKELFMHPFGYNPEFKKFGRVSRPIGTINGAFGISIHKSLDWLAANDPAAIKALEESLFPGKSARDLRNQFMEGASEVTEAMPQSLRTALSLGTMNYFPAHGMNPATSQPATIEGDPFMKDQPFFKMLAQEGRDYLATNTAARYVMPRKGGMGPLVASMAPQVVSPLAIAGANYDPYFDSPVVPPRLESANLLPEDVYTEQTMPLEHVMAEALRKIPGLSETSPIEAGFLWRRYTGSLGSMLLNAGDSYLQAVGIQPERPGTPRNVTDLPLVKAFYGRSPVGSNSKPVRELYDEWERAEKVLNSLEHNKAALKGERMMQIMRDNPEFAAADLLERAVGDLSEMHKKRRKILDSRALEDEDRAAQLYEIDQAMTQYAHVIMMAYNAVIRDPSIMGSLQ